MESHVSTKAAASESAIGNLHPEGKYSPHAVEKQVIGDTASVISDSKEKEGNGNKEEKDCSEDGYEESSGCRMKIQFSSGDHNGPEQASFRGPVDEKVVAHVVAAQRRYWKSRSTQTILSTWNKFDVASADPNRDLNSFLKACDMDMRMIPPSPSSTESTEDESNVEEEDAKKTDDDDGNEGQWSWGKRAEEEDSNAGRRSELREDECTSCEASFVSADKEAGGALPQVTALPYSAADNEVTGVTDSSASDNSVGSSSEFEELDTSAEMGYHKGGESFGEDELTSKCGGGGERGGDFCSSYCEGKGDDDLDVDELADPELREWLRRKLLMRVDRGSGTDSEYDDDESEEVELMERTDAFSTEDKGIQINENDFDDGRMKQTRFAQLSNWLTAKAVPTLGMISQVSRLIQTDCSHLQDLLGEPACRLRAGLDQLEDPSECEQDLDSGAVCEEETAPCQSPITVGEEEDGDDSDASSVDGISDFDLDQTQSTEMPEHLEKLLNSLHRIPPVKSEDGKQNMWMVPSQDDNGNCMNVVLDDGEVYDIYIFRPRCPTSTVSTQTTEAEFDTENLPVPIAENIQTEIIVK